MPSRVIRGDDLFESARYMALPPELQVFYVHILLSADDFGLLSLAPLRVRRLFNKAPSQARIDTMIERLSEVDLVRVYTDGTGAAAVRYLFIPRFGQRLKALRSKCPLPPEKLYQDDSDA